MIFPANLKTYMTILEKVHDMFVADSAKALYCADVPVAKRLAAMLIARNVSIAELMPNQAKVLADLADYFRKPTEFGKSVLSKDLELARPVTLFKKEIKTVNEGAAYGIIGILAAFFGEDVSFIPQEAVPPGVDWEVPRRLDMQWSVPRLRVRGLPKIDDVDKPTGVFTSDVLFEQADQEADLKDDGQYVQSMLYRNAVLKFLKSAQYCPSEGYAVSMISGRGTPSQYMVTDDDDFLPQDMIDRVNSIMHFDPPTGYIEVKDKQYKSYHSNWGILPPLSELTKAQVHDYRDLPYATQVQLQAWNGKSDADLANSKWAEVWIPHDWHSPRHVSRLALDFSAQYVMKQIGAVTQATRGHRGWRKYFIDLQFSYARLCVDHTAIVGIVVENGAFSASLTRLTVDGTEECPEISYTLIAERGFLKDRTSELGTPKIEIDGHTFTVEFAYDSEWRPTGPGLTKDAPDTASSPDAIDMAYESAMGTESRFAPYAAYYVTIKEEVKKK